MNQVQPFPLWLGHAGDVSEWRTIYEADIKALIHLAAEEPASQPPRDFIYCRFPLVDGPGNAPLLIHLAVNTLTALLRKETRTLVYCGGGLSRSPVIAAAALASMGKGSLHDCLLKVKAHHACDVSPGLWEELVSLLPELANEGQRSSAS